MRKPKPILHVIKKWSIGKYRILFIEEIVIPRKTRKDKGTHKVKPEPVADARD